MQKLFLGKSNRLWLQTEESIDTVVLSIVGPTGSYLEDSLDADLQEKACLLDSSSGKYYLDVTLSSSAVASDAYLIWEATLLGITVPLESKYTPEDIVVVESISTDLMLVSPTFVMDHHLRGITESEIEETFQTNFRDVLRDEIKAAHDEMERMTQVFFTPQVITNEYHDYDQTPLYEKFWTKRMFEYPIISVQQVRLMLKDQEIATLPEEWVQVGNAKQGLVKVIPYAGGAATGFAFQLIMTIGAQLALIGGGVYYYPDLFVYDYTAGLDWDTLSTKEQLSIKTAISRRVALSMLPNLDVNRGKSSESKSIDGASASVSYTSSATFGEHSAALEAYKKAEDKWVNSFKRKYLKRLIVEGFQ